jgi:hypothetical protein
MYGSRLATQRSGVQVREGVVKIGPNEPCPCGSKVKYKKCCGQVQGIRGWWRRRKAIQAKREALEAERAGRG